MADLVLVRHGETDGQSSIRLNGITDVGLSELGTVQLEHVARVLKGERFADVVASKLKRSIRSAEIAAQRSPRIVSDLHEIDFGDWETLTWAEVEARDPDRYAICRSNVRDFHYPNGETRAGFAHRIRTAALREFDQLTEPTLAVLHKGVTKTMIGALCRFDWERYKALPCDLGSIHRLRKSADGWDLIESNRIDHLGDTWLQDHPPRS